MSELLGLLTSAAGGGLFGMLGSMWKGRQEHRERESQRAHDLELRKFDSAEMELESKLSIRQSESETAGQLRVLELEGDIEKDIQASKLQEKSYENDTSTYSNKAIASITGWFGNLARFLLVLVDVFRGLMRPGITTYLLVIETAIAYELFKLLSEFKLVTEPQALAMLNDIVHSIIFLAATAVMWWFGSRPTQSKKG